MMTPNKDFLILALDFDSADIALSFLEKVPDIRFVKIGMELFYSEGPSVVYQIQREYPEMKIFLDLKINDIPKTIEKAIRKISDFGVNYVTLFSSQEGIKAALQGRKTPNLKILNVTVLTSENAAKEQILGRAKLSHESGADGVICSGMETPDIRNLIGDEKFIIVNPGIRLKTDSADDQIRIVTPRDAYLNGASNIVMGRPITRSETPEQTVQSIFKSLEIG